MARKAALVLERGRCVFCGYKGKMTAEHVFPLWTRETVLPDVRGDSGYIFRGASGRFEVVPGMPVASLEVKRVCASCNNGWLASLESRAKPLLTRPIQGDPTTLHFMDVHTIATWAYKTCIMADLASSRLLGALPFRWLGQHRYPPLDAVIVMASYGGVRYPQFALSMPVHYKVQSDNGGFDLRAYSITVGIGHLVFQVFGHHIRGAMDLTPSDWKRDYSQVLWPPPASVRWPPLRTLDDANLFRFAGTTEATAEERSEAIWRYPARSSPEGTEAP
ncbi:MAG TPA: hypothetical protein VFI03_11525 [Solirubrobacterales bacterium]|nr:hypothetical protein [Solirubrobacterales bacterium]